MKPEKLAFRNLVRHGGRTALLGALIVLLSVALFGGSTVVISLRNGLKSLGDRLGADVIVIPSTAAARTDLSKLFLQGTTGYYYMKAGLAEQIAQTEGVERASSQIFLASLKADCCSAVVQVIGFDPETDFSILPWVEHSYGRPLGELDVLVGAKVNIDVGVKLRIYGTNCPVVGRLASTGTGLDTAVYCTIDTVRTLLRAANALGHSLKVPGDPSLVVSAVYLKVKKGYSIESVANHINIYFRKAKAVPTRGMISGVSDSLAGIASTVAVIIGGAWLLLLLILTAAYMLMVNERKKEFAALRVIGMSRAMLARTALCEAALIGLLGGLAGIALAALMIYPFNDLIKARLGLPFLLPGPGSFVTLALLALLSVLAVGMLAASLAAHRLSRVDAGVILKEES